MAEFARRNLLPELNGKLRPIILAMKPGTRVTSNQFGMGDWEPDQHLKVDHRLRKTPNTGSKR